MKVTADLAFVFHWSEPDIMELELGELLDYHDLAIERQNLLYKVMGAKIR